MRPKKRTVWRLMELGKGPIAYGRLRRRVPAEMKMQAVLRAQRSAEERHPAGITSEMMGGAITNANGFQIGRNTDHKEFQWEIIQSRKAQGLIF